MSDRQPTENSQHRQISRRRVLQKAAGAAALGATALTGQALSAGDKPKGEKSAEGKIVKHGRIKQSIVHWCFAKYWSVEETAKIAKQLGCVSIELIAPEHWPILKKYDLTCAIASIDMSPDPPFVKGMNNPKYQPQVIKATRDSIDACAANGVNKVISFTGMRENIPDDVGIENCVKGYKKLMSYAEKKKVTVCLEMLNTRDDTHPMKGHPGYQGDHTDYCMEIIKKVGSPRLKLLFDIYHVQIMDGDVIRRIRQYKDDIAHIHTAGNPGRGELDDVQEINYPAVMKALLEVGYKGYVGQEFIPTRDPLKGLKEAVALCDV